MRDTVADAEPIEYEATPVRVAIKPDYPTERLDWRTLNVDDPEEPMWPALLGLCPDGTEELMQVFVYRGDDAEKRALRDKGAAHDLWRNKWEPDLHADQVLKRDFISFEKSGPRHNVQWTPTCKAPPDKSWKQFGLLDVEDSEQLHLLLVPVCGRCREFGLLDVERLGYLKTRDYPNYHFDASGDCGGTTTWECHSCGLGHMECIEGGASVLLADGSSCEMRHLAKGMAVHSTGVAPAYVRCIVRTELLQKEALLVELPGGVLITPNHPVRLPSGDWATPCSLGVPQRRSCEFVYNAVLTNGHTLTVGGWECVTLGHDFTEQHVAHPYYGSQAIVEDLKCADSTSWAAGLVDQQFSGPCSCGELGREEGEANQERFISSFLASDIMSEGVSTAVVQAIHTAALCLSPLKSTFRSEGVSITGQTHQPAPPQDVTQLVEWYCDHTNALMLDSAVEPYDLGAFCLWWLNAVHPFADGNGRTARGLAHAVIATMQHRRGVAVCPVLGIHENFHQAPLRRTYFTELQQINSRCGKCQCCDQGRRGSSFEPEALHVLSNLLKGY